MPVLATYRVAYYSLLLTILALPFTLDKVFFSSSERQVVKHRMKVHDTLFFSSFIGKKTGESNGHASRRWKKRESSSLTLMTCLLAS